MKYVALCVAATMLLAGGTAAQEQINFAGKTITMVVGSPPGGGSDAVARLVAEQLSKYLPGNPKIIVQNQPGAAGITSMNLFYQNAKPDGLAVNMASVSQGDPAIYKQPQVTYDPAKLEFIGGIGRGGSAVIIHKDAEERLYDKTKAPVIMGASPGNRAPARRSRCGALISWAGMQDGCLAIPEPTSCSLRLSAVRSR